MILHQGHPEVPVKRSFAECVPLELKTKPPERVAKVCTQQLACVCPRLGNMSFPESDMFFLYSRQW